MAPKIKDLQTVMSEAILTAHQDYHGAAPNTESKVNREDASLFARAAIIALGQAGYEIVEKAPSANAA
jgi:hypothetical protein